MMQPHRNIKYVNIKCYTEFSILPIDKWNTNYYAALDELVHRIRASLEIEHEALPPLAVEQRTEYLKKKRTKFVTVSHPDEASHVKVTRWEWYG